MLSYLRKKVLDFKSGLWYIIVLSRGCKKPRPTLVFIFSFIDRMNIRNEKQVST